MGVNKSESGRQKGELNICRKAQETYKLTLYVFLLLKVAPKMKLQHLFIAEVHPTLKNALVK